MGRAGGGAVLSPSELMLEHGHCGPAPRPPPRGRDALPTAWPGERGLGVYPAHSQVSTEQAQTRPLLLFLPEEEEVAPYSSRGPLGNFLFRKKVTATPSSWNTVVIK